MWLKKRKPNSQTTIEVGEHDQDSRSSMNVSLRRKLSLAQSFSQRVVTETPHLDPRTSDTSWGPSVGQRADDKTFEDDEGDEITEAELQRKRSRVIEREMRNVRAEMGCFALFWFDFKTWYRRWKHKTCENPFLRSYIKHIERNFGSGIGAMFLFSRWIIMLNVLLIVMWSSFVVIPMAINFNYGSLVEPFAFRNIVDGKGPISKSWVFYCAYVPSFKANGGFLTDFYYHIGLAYLITILLTFFGGLFIILRNMAMAQQPSPSASANSRYLFAFILWSSWDHSITSKEAANNLRKGITSALKDNMYQSKAEKQKVLKKKEKCLLIMRRVIAWVITLILVGGGCAAITYLVLFVNMATSNKIYVSNITVKWVDLTADTDFLRTYVLPIAFSVINMIVPFFITRIPKIEQYKTGQSELNVTIGRIFLLRMANLFALIMSLYSMTSTSSSSLTDTGLCTGTVIGQEIYKLVVMDTIIHTLVKLIISFGMYYWKKVKTEFDIPSAVLVLIYRQALIWIGTMVCPVLPIVGLFSALIFFFLTYGIVRHTCKPPIKRWRQSRRTFFFMSFLLLSLLCVIIPVSIIIGSTKVNLGTTSNTNVLLGPFRSSVQPTSAYSLFANSLSVYWLRDFLLWMISNTVVLPVFLILVSVLGYQKMRLTGVENYSLILQAELQQEREDNKKLVKKIQESML
ncbi:transmembrane channel-like protein 1 isoform X2 [Patella vulgata]|uniref:transmembrane channel-like protein 1 isoform X2 n=1 Tax=Patella vulgata TaxID=6465 RepID=UPI00218092E3|nr:transmembrane channel-like protein 1 isoform X2 [Patella vulgata]